MDVNSYSYFFMTWTKWLLTIFNVYLSFSLSDVLWAKHPGLGLCQRLSPILPAPIQFEFTSGIFGSFLNNPSAAQGLLEFRWKHAYSISVCLTFHKNVYRQSSQCLVWDPWNRIKGSNCIWHEKNLYESLKFDHIWVEKL